MSVYVDRGAPPARAGAASAAAGSPGALALALLAFALSLGVALRFQHLARGDLTGDEAASWAAASAPGLKAVAAMEHRLDPGKLPLYDLALHGWIGAFGDGIVAMRALSAALGTVAIVLVFAAVREACRALGGAAGEGIGDLAGGFAALAYAVNFLMIDSDRTARMYPLAMCAELAQIIFLVRAQRRGGWPNYAGVAISTAAMIAANFTTVFLLIAEGLWLGCLLAAKLAGARAAALAIFRPGAALAAGIALLAPLLPGAVASSRAAVGAGALDWIRMRPPSWLYKVLRYAAGGHILLFAFAILAAFGAWRQRRTAPLAAGFFAIWTAGPVLGLVAVSYTIRPMELPRYGLIAFVGMFAIAAFGAASLCAAVERGRAMLTIALAAALVALSLACAYRDIRHPHEAAWREAAALAARITPPGAMIAVFPQYCENVVRYYTEPSRRAAVHGYDACGSPPVLILSGRDYIGAGRIAAMERCYPRVVARMPLVEVRER